MKKAHIIFFSVLFSCSQANGQSFDFGIQYIPLQASMISFDQRFVIFNDYTSSKIIDPSFKMALPSLSNTGLFVRYNPARHFSFQSGVNFYNNVYYYSEKSTYVSGTYVPFFYSSIDIPLTAAVTLNPDAILKFRLTGGINSKMFRLKRNYYSIFSKSFDYIFHNEETDSDEQKREFMIDKVNPFILFSRIGAGVQFYNITADLCLDKNLTNMNREIDTYNANFKDSYQINLIMTFRIAPKDLKKKTTGDKIEKK